jgi:type IV pilus assembly protein PilQ
VELVIEGVGPTPVLSQGGSAGNGWSGQLHLASPNGLRFGPQRMALPEAGLQQVSLSGAGSDYRLEVVPLPGASLGRPVVSADGRNLVISFASAGISAAPVQQTATADLGQPGLLPQPVYAPPLQPRAVAPPLGDMAVGSMVLRNPSYINVSGPAVTLTLRNAPAKDALMVLAQLGGYGFVYVGDGAPAASPAAGGVATAGTASDGGGRAVTIAFRNESYARALNSVLLAAGLQGKQEGNLILAGPNVLGKSFGPQLSKVFRLNQASANSAADYLASLGAGITKVTVITNSVTQGTSQANQVAGGSTSSQTSTQNLTTTETYGGGVGPLKGLLGTTDSRLQTITLIGDAALVAVAEGYLRQIDHLGQRCGGFKFFCLPVWQ